MLCGVDVNEVLLPGIGLRYEFTSAEGRRIGIVARREGDFEVVGTIWTRPAARACLDGHTAVRPDQARHGRRVRTASEGASAGRCRNSARYAVESMEARGWGRC